MNKLTILQFNNKINPELRCSFDILHKGINSLIFRKDKFIYKTNSGRTSEEHIQIESGITKGCLGVTYGT